VCLGTDIVETVYILGPRVTNRLDPNEQGEIIRYLYIYST
jgi:hypothetical protein